MSADMAPRLGDGSGRRDPFLAIGDDVSSIRARVKAAIEAILPARASLKLSNIVIQNGRVDERAIVVEVREAT